MSTNLSTVTNDLIASYGITTINLINTYRFGGERVLGLVDSGFETVVNRGGAMLRKDLRANLIGRQQRLSGYYVKGLQFGAGGAGSVVGAVVDLASKGVDMVAAGADRIEGSQRVIDVVSRVALPAAQVVSRVVDRIEIGSGALVKRVAGNDIPANALATRKLNSAQSEAAATRKRVVKTATQRVSKVVAKSATKTSNVARRVARKAKATGKSA